MTTVTNETRELETLRRQLRLERERIERLKSAVEFLFMFSAAFLILFLAQCGVK